MKSYALALIKICLPLILFLNISATMNNKEYFGFSSMLEVVKQVPTFDNTITEVQKMEKELTTIKNVFSPSNTDTSFFENAANFFSSIFKLLYLLVTFSIGFITDIVNIISFVFSAVGGAIL